VATLYSEFMKSTRLSIIPASSTGLSLSAAICRRPAHNEARRTCSVDRQTDPGRRSSGGIHRTDVVRSNGQVAACDVDDREVGVKCRVSFKVGQLFWDVKNSTSRFSLKHPRNCLTCHHITLIFHGLRNDGSANSLKKLESV
jgi:hypothetical protein